ncbi:glycosyltransferase family 2 protein [Treponema denticola]|nr:glycosyltransferase family A protein [Treponema denticola]
MNRPIISLSVPVYGMESFLPAFLDSVLAQNLLLKNSVQKSGFFSHNKDTLPIEVLIVNDGSPGGSSLPKILKPYKKKFKNLGITLTLLEHRKNLGLFEARRTAANAASGSYIFFADPDDTLPSDSLLVFYNGLLASGNGNLSDAADIIHGKMRLSVPQFDTADKKNAERFDAFSKSVQSIHSGFLSGNEVLENFLIKKEHSGFLCAKLFRTSLLQEVYAELPNIFCIMSEDLLLYFFVLLKKPSYYGIDSFVYNYINDTGISSVRQVTSLDRWEKICSGSSVFTLIFSYIQEHPIDEKYIDELRIACNNQLKKNITKMNKDFTGSLRAEAYAILCDYWGEDYVKQIEKSMKDEEQK